MIILFIYTYFCTMAYKITRQLCNLRILYRTTSSKHDRSMRPIALALYIAAEAVTTASASNRQQYRR